MSARNKFLIVLGVILAIASGYYFFSTPAGNDLVLVGTVDANQIVVSPQIQGRILKLLVEEGTQVKQGDLIALLDPSELEAEERAAAATIGSLRSQMSENEYTRQVDERVDVERCGEFAGEAAIGAGATGAGGSDFDAGGERQPADDWIGAGGRGIGSGPGAGGDESEGASRRACSR